MTPTTLKYNIIYNVMTFFEYIVTYSNLKDNILIKNSGAVDMIDITIVTSISIIECLFYG